MEEKLKPCPFCGGKAEISPYNGSKTIVCMNCLCMSAAYKGDNAKEEAVVTWNNRPDNWISVEERLPENNQEVLVFVNDGADTLINTDTYNNGWQFWYKHVTHWQPLPEPPRGDS